MLNTYELLAARHGSHMRRQYEFGWRFINNESFELASISIASREPDRHTHNYVITRWINPLNNTNEILALRINTPLGWQMEGFDLQHHTTFYKRHDMEISVRFANLPVWPPSS